MGREGALGVAQLEHLAAQAEHGPGDRAVAPPRPDEAAGQAGGGRRDRRQAAGLVVQGADRDGDGEVRGDLVAQAGEAAVEGSAQAVCEGVVPALVEGARAGVLRGAQVVPVLPALLSGLGVAGGVGGVVRVDGHLGGQEGVQELAALEVELAAGDQPAGAVVLAPHPQPALLVGVLGPALELVRQERVEQLPERCGQVAGLDVGGEQQERLGQPGELRPAGDGDRPECLRQGLQQRVVVGHAAASLADHAQHAVHDDGLDGRLGGLSVDEPVGAVQVRPELDQRGGDACGDGDRQRPAVDGGGDGRERRPAPGQRHLGAREAGLLRAEPGAGRGCVGQGVERAGVDVRDAAQDQRPEALELSDQRRRIGEGLRRGQVRGHHPEQGVDGGGERPDRR